MKKLTALILTAVMLVCMTAIVPVSADANKLVMTAVETAIEANAGDTITLKWNHNDDAAYFNMRYKIEYDSSVFTYNDKKKAFYEKAYGDFISIQTNAANENAVNVLVKNTEAMNLIESAEEWGVYEEGLVFCSFQFAVAADAPTGDYTFTMTGLESSNFASQLLTVEAAPTITVHVNGVDPEPEGPTVVEGLKTVGGQVRVPVNGVEPEKFGFRFVSTMDATVEAVEYGTLVIPTDLLEGELVAENATAEKVVAAKVMSEENDVVTFNATMVEIKDANLKRNFTSRAYAKLADGSYVYGAAYETNIYNVAKAAVDAGEAVEYLTTNVLDKAK